MSAELTKKLKELVEKEGKISIKKAAELLKADESDVIEAAMKLSDEFAVMKKKSKVSAVSHTQKSNTPALIDELRKVNKKAKVIEKNLSKELDSCISYLAKKKIVENEEAAKKEIAEFSKNFDQYEKLVKEAKKSEKKRSELWNWIKKYGKLLDSKKILLGTLIEESKKADEKISKEKQIVNDSCHIIKEMLAYKKGESNKKRSIMEALGIKKFIPENKIKSDDESNLPTPKEIDEMEKNGQEENNEVIRKDIKFSGKFSTEIDALLGIVKEESKVSFKRLAQLYEEKVETIEEWCKALEEKKIISIHYPLIGSPYIKYEEKKTDKVE